MTPQRVLVVSATMGAGHHGAAREIARRVREIGHEAEVVDFLEAFPKPLARAWTALYRAQLRFFPESYERSYQTYYSDARWWSWYLAAVRRLSSRWVRRSMRAFRPDVVISTYPFATLVIGELKDRGAIAVPAVNFLTDFGVHPRAVHSAFELHLTVHEVSAIDARRLVDAPVVATGPVVAPAFAEAAAGGASGEGGEGGEGGAREHTRAELGIADDQRMVLVTTGSWGVGHEIEHTVETLIEAGGYHVVTICGRDHRLAASLRARRLGVVIEWSDQMPALMAASDALVENAGGLTAMEAFASGLPVINYKSIPGHGRDNARAMARAGVATVTETPAELLSALRELTGPSPRRTAQIAAAHAMFADPVGPILALLARTDPSADRGLDPTATELAPASEHRTANLS